MGPSKHLMRRLSLAYNLHKPPEAETQHAPIIILHGLFGSKQNNRSISKYAKVLRNMRSALTGLGQLREI